MKASKSIKLTILPIVAAAITSCAEPERNWQHCVDASNKVVPDAQCDDQVKRQAGGVYPNPYLYRWIYAPRPYVVGDTITAIRTTAVPSLGAPVRASGAATVSRGGFGASSGFGIGE